MSNILEYDDDLSMIRVCLSQKLRSIGGLQAMLMMTMINIGGCDDDGDDASKGVLLSSDLSLHFLAAEKIFVLKILSHFTFSPMRMMMMIMIMMKTMGLKAIQNFQTIVPVMVRMVMLNVPFFM